MLYGSRLRVAISLLYDQASAEITRRAGIGLLLEASVYVVLFRLNMGEIWLHGNYAVESTLTFLTLFGNVMAFRSVYWSLSRAGC